MADVALRGVSKSYGNVDVIHDVSLDVEQGEFVVFVGPSGCGKSTLLRMIAGLEEVTQGDVLIGGARVNDTAARDRGVAMVFQNYALYPHMSVRENMAFGLRNIGTPRTEIDSRIAKAAEILQLDSYLDRKPRAMSGGQRQRVAIGRAIVREPDVFLFDEPLSNLDAALRVQMRTEIARIHHRLGATMIYVTHDQTEAMTMADRIVVLRAGVIEQVGAPLDLYERPANLFVAGFLGSPKMNFLPGRITAAQGPEVQVEVAGGVRLPARVRPGSAAAGDTVTLGLRPEMLQVHPDGPLRGHVDVVEQLGHVQLVYATLPDRTAIVAELRDRRPPAVGTDIPLAPGPGLRHVFDAQGLAITLPEEVPA
ncbi:ABC transporter ATP-binding protein [Rubellimicrobium roseum]|uniref:sn-glycerol-3-phosphate ABC transporter ATP-binding protein UgpC n=1 Tax=Rubellimicrobium roseum TaxID=687525 RepID=A0A5C4N8L6_9RHOB|nr:sn-glycerol-3-phosphate ABC transporter ATP-binding protein UgpC [Rubellimicrobium roseum]TNC65027.1 sn-glycerol-3-phosphate ABC transporter ATP-binding protein UgpC [Rubellimicrobium roseum]